MSVEISVEKIMEDIKNEAKKIRKIPVIVSIPINTPSQTSIPTNKVSSLWSLGDKLLQYTKPLPIYPVLEKCAITIGKVVGFIIPRQKQKLSLNTFVLKRDIHFIRSAYQKLLLRSPNEEENRLYFERLSKKKIHPIELLCQLQYSQEGRVVGRRVEGVLIASCFQKLFRIPIIGQVIRWIYTVFLLPTIIQEIQEQNFSQDNIPTQDLGMELQKIQEASERNYSELKNIQHDVLKLRSEITFDGVERNIIPENNAEHHLLRNFYLEFEHQFRGTREEIKSRLLPYLDMMSTLFSKNEGMSVLDVGCGRGEWLELLDQKGYQTYGIDIDESMIEFCHAQKFKVECVDAHTYLSQKENESVDVVTAFHVIEHFSFADMLLFFSEVRRVLKPGGLAIFETPNPKNITVGACNFYSDPTHIKPLYPETIEFAVKYVGFNKTSIQYMNAIEMSPFDQKKPDGAQLHGWFYCARDYSVIGFK